MRRSDLVKLMSELEAANFHASIESGPPGIQARGTAKKYYYQPGVEWAVAREGESAQWLGDVKDRIARGLL